MFFNSWKWWHKQTLHMFFNMFWFCLLWHFSYTMNNACGKLILLRSSTWCHSLYSLFLSYLSWNLFLDFFMYNHLMSHFFWVDWILRIFSLLLKLSLNLLIWCSSLVFFFMHPSLMCVFPTYVMLLTIFFWLCHLSHVDKMVIPQAIDYEYFSFYDHLLHIFYFVSSYLKW